MEKILLNALIAFCQREGLLPTDSDSLADMLQQLAADEMYISKMDIESIID